MPSSRTVTAGPSAAGAPLSPRIRLAALVLLLAAAGAAVARFEPHRMLGEGRSALDAPSGLPAMLLFTAVYAVCAAAFAPRPVLSVAAGLLFGAVTGTVVAVAGTVLAALLAFGLGRLLGREALRPLLRGRLLTGLERQMSERGFRTMTVLRLLPLVPFALTSYAAAVSRMPWGALAGGTAVGTLPTTAGYCLAGSTVWDPLSPAFLLACSVPAAAGLAALALRRRRAPEPRGGPG
ncbi:TVP38/TMEM64 family protein [Streptomyces sp. YIM 98790]|uniref:TVP38/TMEM64 family protein n=1 Tax=Streptomyces sp. YIM 98790 TaxID=2689077 RepID=UPI0028BE3346|nr:TVP38/TMEM64 family protein [Streptomyces sp. YIM 98790]